MLIRALLLLTATSGIFAAPRAKQTRGEGDPAASVLAVKVSSYRVENADMETALRALRQVNLAKILIGFEEVARTRGQAARKFSISLENTTVGEVVNALCKEDSSYAYDVVENRLIHVYPRNHDSDPAGLLNIRILDLSVNTKIVPAAIIDRISRMAPELSSYMEAKQEEFFARRGIVPGSPGANMSGNMDPEVHIQFKDMTVRQVLNSIVLYSQKLYEKAKPDPTGYRIPPTSWIYKFVIDPDAKTGLGGTPYFTAF